MFSGRNSGSYERLEGGHGPGRSTTGRNFAWKKFAVAAVALITLIYLFGPRETPRVLGGDKTQCASSVPPFDVFAHRVSLPVQLPPMMAITTLSHLLMAIPTTPLLLTTSARAPARSAHLQLNLTRIPVTPNSQHLNLPHPQQTIQIR